MRYLIILTLVLFLVGCGGESSNTVSDSSQGSSSTGKGGSMARFVVSGDYLYALNKRELIALDITDADKPSPYTRDSVNFDVETLFSYGDYLYIGAESGVYIYSKPTPSKSLEEVSSFIHAKSCDPVVVKDGFAYITLRSGSSCRVNSVENSLQILDVSNPLDPIMSKNSNGDDNIRQMFEPKGLGIDNNTLFVCDGIGGLKVFNIEKNEDNETNQTRVDLIYDRSSSLSEIDCYDVIPYNNNLVISNGEDVRQFDYSKFPMVELGRIK